MHKYFPALSTSAFYRASTVVLLFLSAISLKCAEQADLIVNARYVVTMDGDHHVIENGALVVNGKNVVAVGKQSEIAARYRSNNVLNRTSDAVMPGLIDTHTHAAMSLMRGLADDHRLQDWLKYFIFPAESKNVTPEYVIWGTRLACLEMMLAGITTYTDMYYFEDHVAQATREIGVRGVLGQTVIGFPTPGMKTWQEGVQNAASYIDRFRNDDLIVPAVAPHAIYTTPDEALVASRKLATQKGVPLLIHVEETKTELDESLGKRKMTPVQVLDRLGILDGRVLAAHCVWASEDDIAILKRHNTGVAHCPVSNMKLASGIAPVASMLKQGINVGFGTDGFAGSNDTADLLFAANVGAQLQKVTQKDPEVLPAEQALDMATIGGARALGLDKTIGSLEAGKRADFVVMALNRPNMTPLYNIYSQIIYSGKAADIEDVFVNGRQLVNQRQVLTVNQPQVLAKANEYGLKIKESIRPSR